MADNEDEGIALAAEDPAVMKDYDDTYLSELTEKTSLENGDIFLARGTDNQDYKIKLAAQVDSKINGALANYKGLNLNVDYTVTLPTDFNLLIGEDNKTIVYAILGTDSNTLNRPENNTNMGYLTVSRATIRNRYTQRWENVQNYAVYERIYNGSSWTSWQKIVTESDIKTNSKSWSNSIVNEVYSKLTITVNVPYTTTVVALMGRGGGLALVGICANDKGNANFSLYLKNAGTYNSTVFYYKPINENTIELYWLQGSYSIYSNHTILTNPENTTTSFTTVTSLPTGTTQI